MRIETHGQQIEVTNALREYVESKLARLKRHFDQPLDVRTLLSLDKPDHKVQILRRFERVLEDGIILRRLMRNRSDQILQDISS